MDQPGEWFLDRASGRLYFWPPANSETAGVKTKKTGYDELLLSLLAQPLVKLTGVSHVTFSGLILEASRGNAVEIAGGASNLLAGCT